MSNVAEKIESLENDVRVAQELLFLVLDHVDEPVVLDIEESKKKISSDRMIDVDLDTENNRWVLKVVTIPNG